jgi:hypothetical protein
MVRLQARERKILFSTSSIPAVGPTQPPVQWVPVLTSLGIKRPGRKTDNFRLVPKSMAELYLHSPIYFHGVVLNYVIKQKHLYMCCWRVCLVLKRRFCPWFRTSVRCHSLSFARSPRIPAQIFKKMHGQHNL